MITYNLAPIPIWCLRDIDGLPLANGRMFTYRDTVRSEFKPIYQDAGGTLPYLNPVLFNAAGFAGPFYWSSDENYYIEIYDSDDRLVRTIQGYNASGGSSGPVTNEIDFTNFIYDSQWRYIRKRTFNPLPVAELLGSSNWYIEKANTTATDNITIQDFSAGSTAVDFNPNFFLQFQCTVPGSGETYKELRYVFPSVFSFQNTEVTFALWARNTSGSNVLEVFSVQYFGTGGSPSVQVRESMGVINTTGSWVQYKVTHTIPSITGKVIGTNQNDYFSINIGLPRDAATNIQITNVQLNLGNKLMPFDYLTPTNNATLQIPFYNSVIDRSKTLKINNDGELKWTNQNPVDFHGTSSIQTNTIINTNPGNNINWLYNTGFSPSWFSAGQFIAQISCVVIFSVNIIVEFNQFATNQEILIQVLFNNATSIAWQSTSGKNKGTAEVNVSGVINMAPGNFLVIRGSCEPDGLQAEALSGFIHTQILT